MVAALHRHPWFDGCLLVVLFALPCHAAGEEQSRPFVCSREGYQSRTRLHADLARGFFQRVGDELANMAEIIKMQEAELAIAYTAPQHAESVERVCAGGRCDAEDAFWGSATTRTAEELEQHGTGYWVEDDPQRRSEVYFPAWAKDYELAWDQASTDATERHKAPKALREMLVKPRDSELLALCAQEGFGACAKMGSTGAADDDRVCPSWCLHPEIFNNSFLTYEALLSQSMEAAARVNIRNTTLPVDMWYWVGVSGHFRAVPPFNHLFGPHATAAALGPDHAYPVAFAGPAQNPSRSTVWTPVHIDEAGAMVTTAAHPVYVAGRWLGAVEANINLASLHRFLAPLFATESSLILLSDTGGHIIGLPARTGSFLLCPGHAACGGSGNLTFMENSSLANQGLMLQASRHPQLRSGGALLESIVSQEERLESVSLAPLPGGAQRLYEVAWTTIQELFGGLRVIMIAPQQEIEHAANAEATRQLIPLHTAQTEVSAVLTNNGSLDWEWQVSVPSGLVQVDPQAGTMRRGETTHLHLIRNIRDRSLEVTVRSQGIYAACFPPINIFLALACDAGMYRDGPLGADTCMNCTAGHQCQSDTIAACRAGSYQDEDGQSECKPCEKGRFASDSGQVDCVSCLADTVEPFTTLVLGAQSHDDCVCDDGYYRPAGATSCTKCTCGMECQAGMQYPMQAMNFYVEAAEGDTGRFDVYRCLEGHCLAGEPGGCASGRTGLACGECKDGHYPSRKAPCAKCEGFSALPLIVTLLCCVVLLVILFFHAGSDVATQRHVYLTLLCTGGQTLVALQALATLNSVRLRGVEPVETMLSLTAFVNIGLETLRLPCIFGSYSHVAGFVTSLLSIPAMCLLYFCVFGILKVTTRRQLVKDDLVSSLGFLVNIFYLPVTLLCIKPFHCVSNPNGSSSVATMPSVLCGSSEHMAVVPAGAIGILVYPTSVLCGTAFLTLIFPRLVSAGGGAMLARRFRFIFQRFTPACYFYAVLYLLRSVLMAVPPVLFPSPGHAPLFCLTIVVAGFTCVQCWLKPWRTRAANITDAALALATVMVLAAATALVQANPDAVEGQIGGFMWATLVIALLVMIGLLAFFVLKSLRSRGHCYDAFLSHHKGGAARLARLTKCMLEDTCRMKVFLDSDELDDLEQLFNIVRTDVRNLVVLLTTETLRRLWCAGELVVAHKNGVPIVPVAHHGFGELGDAILARVQTFWTPDEMLPLTAAGITLTSIADTYRHLQELEAVTMPATIKSTGALKEMDLVATRIAHRCCIRASSHGPGDSFAQTSQASVRRTVVDMLMNVSDLEATAGAAILARLVSKQTQWEIGLLFSPQQIEETTQNPSAMLVLLTRGCLESSDYASLLYFSRKKWPSVPIISVRADATFAFPGEGELSVTISRVARGLGIDKRELQPCYAAVLNLLALPFSAHLHMRLIETETAMICRRVHGATTKNGSASRSDDELGPLGNQNSAAPIPAEGKEPSSGTPSSGFAWFLGVLRATSTSISMQRAMEVAADYPEVLVKPDFGAGDDMSVASANSDQDLGPCGNEEEERVAMKGDGRVVEQDQGPTRVLSDDEHVADQLRKQAATSDEASALKPVEDAEAAAPDPIDTVGAKNQQDERASPHMENVDYPSRDDQSGLAAKPGRLLI